MKKIELRNYERKIFLKYLGDNYRLQPNYNDNDNETFFIDINRDRDSEPDFNNDGKNNIQFLIYPSGYFNWYYNNDIFKIEYYEEGNPVECDRYGAVYFQRLYVCHKDINKLKDFITMTFNYEIKNDKDNKVILYSSKIKCYPCWEKCNSVNVQSIENIFIDNKIKKDIINLIDNFYKLKERYIKFGRVYKLNILLTGVPGSGKTCLCKAIAKKYERPIYVLNFGKGLTDELLLDLITDVKPNSILLLEDIDSYFKDRIESDSTSVSFSGLINALDGVLSNGNGIITILTANHSDRLDSALIRPGRVDKIIKFDYPKKNEIKEAFNSLIESLNEQEKNKNFEIFYEKIDNIRCNMSGIIDYLFRYQNEYLDNIEEFINQTKLMNDILKLDNLKIYT